MSYYKQKRSYTNFNTFQLGKGEKLVTSKFAEMKSNPYKLWYGIIEANGKSYVSEYPSRLRHDAVLFFEGEATKLNGRVVFIKAV